MSEATRHNIHRRAPHPPPPTQQQPTLPANLKLIHQCHKCSNLLRLHAMQIPSILKQQSLSSQTTHAANDNHDDHKHNNNDSSATKVSLQCVYIKCPTRSNKLFECTQCSNMGMCRNCEMPLCEVCRQSLKVLQCNYCKSFICSQQCYTSLLQKYFQYLEHFGLSIHAHESMHFFRKLLLAPHLGASLQRIPPENIPFHICESCKVQNCGCVDWLSCVNCRKYYCVDCEDKMLTKCALEDCQSRTCCKQRQWNRACEYCNRMKNCRLIFCTKGHCDRHIIVNREVGYHDMRKDEQDEQDETEQVEATNDNDNANDIDVSDKK